VLGYLIHLIKYPRLPLVISLVLGGVIERYYDQSMMLSNGSPSVFVSTPITIGLAAMLAGAILYMPVARSLKAVRRRMTAGAGQPVGSASLVEPRS
jgi:putative tricarboxylic transport membrane protein